MSKALLLIAGLAALAALQGGACWAYDEHKIFFAGDSGATYCRESAAGPDLAAYSLFNLLRASPPPGFAVEPDLVIPSESPCSGARSDISGYGGLKILDWLTPVTDAAGEGVCAWSCGDCPDNYTVHNNGGPGGGTIDWCCCGSRRACFDRSDARYVLLELGGNDLWQLYLFYDRDVDLVVEQAKALTLYLTGQGRKVIWLSPAPTGYGGAGWGEVACTDWTSCLYSLNSNTGYLLSRFTPWLEEQDNASLIDFFSHVTATYGADQSFSDQYSYDGVHLTPEGHQIFYSFVSTALLPVLGIPTTTTSVDGQPAKTIGPSATTTTATACTYAIAPAARTVPAAGAAGRVSITAQADCTWSARSAADWIIVAAGSGGQGSSEVRYAVLPNPGGERSGSVEIAGEMFTITQHRMKAAYLLLLPLLWLWLY